MQQGVSGSGILVRSRALTSGSSPCVRMHEGFKFLHKSDTISSSSPPRCSVDVYLKTQKKCKRISVLFIDLFYRNQFSGCLFSAAFSPLSVRARRKKMKNKILYSEREKEEKNSNTTSERMGKLN